MITNVVILICGLANAVILARFLGPTDRGEVAAVLLWPTLLPYLGATGVIDALVYFAAKPGVTSKSAFGSSILLASLVSIILIPVGFVSLPWLLGSQSDEVVSMSRVMLVGIPLTLFGEMVSSMLRAKLALGGYNAQRLLVPVGYLIATLILFFFGMLSVRGVAYAQLVLWGCRLILSILLCQYNRVSLSFSWNRKLTLEMLSFGGKSHLGAMAERVNSQLDQVVIAGWLSPVSLGHYVAAKGISSIITTVPLAVKISILPRLAGESNASNQKSLIARVMHLYWAYALLITPVFSLGLVWIIPFIYGQEFEAAILPSIFLLYGAIFFGAKDILGVASKAIGSPLISSVAEIVSLVVGGILLVIFVSSKGMIGAAYSTIGASAAALIAVTMMLHRIRDLPYISMLPSFQTVRLTRSYTDRIWGSIRSTISSHR